MMVGGMPLLELVARRAARTGFEVVVATSVESYDDRIAQVLQDTDVPVIRGSLDDVLGRFLVATSDLEEDDTVIRLTGDNPVIDADLIQEIIDAVEDAGLEYGLYDMGRVPEGLGVEVFPVRLLRQAAREATDPFDREHVTPWIRRHTEELSYAPKANPGHPSIYRVSVDCLHDFTRVSRLFDAFADPVSVAWQDIMNLLIAQVRALGPTACEVSRAPRRITSLLLGVGKLKDHSTETQAAATRAIFTRAAEAGISDVVCTAEEAPIINTGILPMLKQRMGVSIALPAVSGEECPTTHLRYLLERARVTSGHASLRGVLLDGADLESEHVADLIAVLAEYVEEGTVAEIGVLLAPGQCLSAEDFSQVEVVAADLKADGALDCLRSWKAAGRTSLGISHSKEPAVVSAALTSGAVHSVVVQPSSQRELTSLLTVG